jgi:hypothetical protein
MATLDLDDGEKAALVDLLRAAGGWRHAREGAAVDTRQARAAATTPAGSLPRSLDHRHSRAWRWRRSAGDDAKCRLRDSAAIASLRNHLFPPA